MRIPLIAIFILIPLVAYADKQADSIDRVVYKRQLKQIRDGVPEEYKEHESLWLKKKSILGSWRWDIGEFYHALNGFLPTPPEYYYDDEFKVSNNGWVLT